MITTGPFETTTKTKIKTPHGTVLKVTTYDIDCIHPSVEYKIRSTCTICNKDKICYCFLDEEYYNNAFDEALENLTLGHICENPDCVIKYQKENNPDSFAELLELHGTDPYKLRNAIWETWGEWDDGPEVCGI